jgi:energy-coupling factor transport system permease protein
MPGAGAQLVYRRRPTPLHAARATVAAAFGLALAFASLLLENPIVLASLLSAVLLAAAAAGVAGPLLRVARRTALPLLVLTVLVNVLVNREGLTVFARLGDWGVLGQVDLTVEAVVYGLVFALRLLVVTLACLLVVCAADPDQLLFSLRRFSPRSALTAALATRLVPVLGQDARRLAEAQRCRADASGGARARLAILRATVTGALDRALDVAAVLEMRGYGAEAGGSLARRRPPIMQRPRSRHDLAFALSGAAIVALALIAKLAGLAAFHAYPLVSLSAGPATFAIAVSILAVALLPFADRRGVAT